MNNTRTATAVRQGRAAANGGGNSQSARPDIRKAMKKLESTGSHAEKKLLARAAFFLSRPSAAAALRKPTDGTETVENLLIIFVLHFFPFSNKLAYICTHERNVAKYHTKRLPHRPRDAPRPDRSDSRCARKHAPHPDCATRKTRPLERRLGGATCANMWTENDSITIQSRCSNPATVMF